MIGAASGLGCALLWALSSVMTKSQTATYDAFFLNAFRCLLGGLLFLILGVCLGSFAGFLSSPPLSLLSLAAAALCSLVIGDTMFYHSMGLIGVSKTLPIACCSPIFTLIISVTVFGKPVGWITAAGVGAAVAGIYLVATSQAGARQSYRGFTKNTNTSGIILALLAALFWALGTNLLHFGVGDSDVVAVNAFRLTIAALPLMVMVLHREKGMPLFTRDGWRPLWMLIGASIIGSVGGTMLFVISVKHAGAAKAAVLSSVAPLFAVPMSMVLLKERVNFRLPFGAILSVAGVWLVLTP